MTRQPPPIDPHLDHARCVMRSRFLAFPFALVLALGLAGIAAADTTPGDEGSQGGLDVAITSIAVNPRTGLVTVSGEVTCEVDFDWVGAGVDLSQVVGRLFTIRGWGWADPGGCEAADGAVPFTMSFTADSGRFAPGKAQVRVEAWGEGGCMDDPETGDYTCETWGEAFHGPLPVRLHPAR
jgi:hypothetical protein